MRLVVVCGPVAAGKTSYVQKTFDPRRTHVIHADNYFHDLSHMSPDERRVQNFDVPSAVDSARLARDVRTLLQGLFVSCGPRYDFITHTATFRTLIAPRDEQETLVVEGHLAAHLLELEQVEWDECIYVDAPEDVCLARRLRRDVLTRGWSREDIVRIHTEHTRPARILYVEPQMHMRKTTIFVDAAERK